MNKVLLIGRLTRDPEVRYSGQNQEMAIAKFTLAVDRKYKKDGEQSADFINCVAFRKSAEFAEKYLKQGTKIALEGHWQTGSFENKEGHKVYTNDCVVDSMEFAESKRQETAPQTNSDGFQPIEGDEEHLPFV